MRLLFNKYALLTLTAGALFVLLSGCAQSTVKDSNSGAGSNISTVTGTSSVQQTATSTPVTTNTSSTSVVPATPVTKDDTPVLTKISEILQNAKAYDGRIVIVQGKIVSECGSGCWFTLKDGNAVIYIDLAPNNMVIPQKRGADAKVTGKVVKEGSDVYMIGSKVEF